MIDLLPIVYNYYRCSPSFQSEYYIFLKRLRYVCSEKHPYLPNCRKLMRSGIAMNNFMVSMNVFSKGLLIFTADLRAVRHSDWYCIRSVSLVIFRRVRRLLKLLKINESCNAFLVYHHVLACFFARFHAL